MSGRNYVRADSQTSPNPLQPGGADSGAFFRSIRGRTPLLAAGVLYRAGKRPGNFPYPSPARRSPVSSARALYRAVEARALGNCLRSARRALWETIVLGARGEDFEFPQGVASLKELEKK
jgi:hypothetical protein